MALKLDDIPFALHANDIVKHIINIDSRFREPSPDSDAGNFYFRLPTPIRNVLRIRVTSIEFANNYFIFSAARRNVTLWITYGYPDDQATVSVVIPDGNYLVMDMLQTLTSLFASSPVLNWLSVEFNTITGEFIFRGTKKFSINTACNSNNKDTWDRPIEYGLGYNLGFSRGVFMANEITPDLSYNLISNQTAYFAGDSYLFLKVNDYECVRQTVDKGYQFTALAKIILTQSKDFMTFDDYTGHHAKEVTFTAPTDLTRFHIQLLDPHGQQVRMGSAQFSFSLEVLEVRNTSLYNTIRDTFATRWSL